jgi:uncharacterized UPF0160 family protein
MGIISLRDIFCDALFDTTARHDLSDVFNVMFNHTVKIIQDKIAAKSLILKGLQEAENKKILVLEQKTSYGEFLTKMRGGRKVCFVILLTRDGFWKICPTSKNDYSKEFKVNFPKEWCGYSEDRDKNEELKDIIFIHPHGIMALAKTKESAIEFATLVLNKN